VEGGKGMMQERAGTSGRGSSRLREAWKLAGGTYAIEAARTGEGDVCRNRCWRTRCSAQEWQKQCLVGTDCVRVWE
jgi:hypothetical protein